VTKFVQTLVDALAVGGLYALIALGYSLVYGVLKFINFAHSDVFAAGAWISVTFAQWAGWMLSGEPPPWWALPAVLGFAMAFCASLGFVIERFAYRPLRSAERINVLITAIGVSLLIQNVGQLKGFFGADPAKLPPLLEDTSLFTVADVHIRLVDVIVIALAFGLAAALQWLVYGTRFGRAMRAVSFDMRIASLMGIHVNRVVSAAFVIGSALAAAAGLLYAMKYQSLNQPAHSTWVLLGLKAFVAAVVGGIGNVRGALYGALLIAFVEMFGAAYLSPHLRDVYVFGVLIAVLLLRPAGILGRAVTEKV
jgi:branched-chain amino acid transport system permease protein